MVTIPFSSLAFAPEKGSNRIILSTDKAFAGWELYIDDVTLTTVSEAVTLENFDGYEAGDSVPTSYLSAGTAVSFVTSPAAAGTAVKGVLAAGVYNQICFSRDSLGSAFSPIGKAREMRCGSGFPAARGAGRSRDTSWSCTCRTPMRTA